MIHKMRKGDPVINDSIASSDRRSVAEFNKRVPMLNKIMQRNGTLSSTRRDRSDRSNEKINNFKAAFESGKSKSPQTVHDRLYN